MALDITNLSQVARRTFHYETTDAIATVAASGYFNDATLQLQQFDHITVSSATGGTPLIDLIHVTSATHAATVTTTNGT